MNIYGHISHIVIYVYIRRSILTFASKYLVKYKRYGKMFSIKVLLL